MGESYYSDALRSGQKELKACVNSGKYPYLKVLDDIVPEEKYLSGVNLGIIQIPISFIVGTKTSGRTEAFARNFMPIMPDSSEFAAKWRALCSSHLEEGIHEPITVYEYMNRYYVCEGNKRVSVLKFFGAVNVPAQVTRILPERIPENELYFEYLAFNRYSKINFIEFSKIGSYALFQRLMGKKPEEEWTEEERRKLSSDFYYFMNAYEENGGKKLNVNIGDAFLACVRVYGYETIRSMGSSEMKKAIAKMWEEMALQQEETPIEVKTDPVEEQKPGILSQLLPGISSQRPLKVTFVYDRSPDVSGWVLGHELGRIHVQSVFEEKIVTEAIENVMEGNPAEILEKAVSNGSDVIFTASPRLLDVSLRVAIDHPEVTVLNCSLNTSHRYIRTYYARMYEAKFIIGAAAGAMSQSGRVGYVCDYPIFGQIAGINAFALGVQMVNPRTKVYLEWSGIDGSDAAVERLRQHGIQLISSQDIGKLAKGSRNSFGLSRITDEGDSLLAAPVWNWGVYYEEIIRSILNKSFQKEYETSKKALNYYWGMSAGVVTVNYSNKLPQSVRKMTRYLKEGICAGAIHPFLGPIVKQDGSEIGDEHSALSVEEIINMDYLVENVIGRIVSYEELSDVGKATVDMVGIQSVQRSDGKVEEV